MVYSIVIDKEKGVERTDQIRCVVSSKAALKMYGHRPKSVISILKLELLGISLGGLMALMFSLYHLVTGNTAIALIMAGPVFMAVLGWAFVWFAPKLRSS